MMNLILAGIIPLALTASELEAEAETYAAAYEAILESGRPMVVMVGTDWWPPCQAMRRQVLPALRRRRWFGRVVFARVNSEREARLARRLTGGGPVPQLVMFRRTPEGWVRRKLVGRHNLETVERFIEQGIALDEATRRQAAARLTSGRRSEKADHSAPPTDGD